MHKTVNELSKSIFTVDPVATLNRYQSGKLYYRFTLNETTYEFAIDTMKQNEDGTFSPSKDVLDVAFPAQIQAKKFSLWIREKATKNELTIIK